mmetsp:Transcript_3610/g.5587  ORF Transcript_3610/g.5587 Transcript_3610/m.5587 type:complete len:567 (-) Transcript_3610:82-1782(-)|eukprot:CAMPEP_0196807238 /NCGR_PEP_ID=MMETSP1362-20130617/7199_1 /TAXON_ID=163516 /ORGANISM="Leptocylindrus danicus, Strain CCMP1856" /LENGTH=566 /DNA_ID=CAMNT_0042181067 /DNA_START=2377 /DNA_END=4077 /DNA_ORIENTATION=+
MVLELSSATSGNRKEKRAQNLEEVFHQLSGLTGASIAVPESSRTILTPITKQACEKHGINPEALKLRDLDSFWENGIDKEIQILRHDAYSRRRGELMEIARNERSKLQKQESSTERSMHSVSSVCTDIWEQQAKTSYTLIEMEEMRLAKLKKRKEKEIMDKIQYEQKLLEIQNQMKLKEEKEVMLEEKRQRHKARKMRQAAEERRLKQLRRQAQLEAEEVHQKKLVQQLRQREAKILAEKEQAKRQIEIQARIIEQERQRKIREAKIQTQRFLEQKQKDAEAKDKKRKEQEHARQAKLDQKIAREKLILEAKRKATSERLERNRQAAYRKEEEKKNKILKKKEIAERNRSQHLQVQERQKHLKRQQRELDEQRRHMQLESLKNVKEDRKQMLMQKFEADKDYLHELKQRRARELAIAKEKRDLSNELKKENVIRIKKAQEYEAQRVLEKISEDEKRAEEMLKRRAELALHRKNAAIEAKRQKDLLVNMLENTRGNNSIKKIRDILEGNKPKPKKSNMIDEEPGTAGEVMDGPPTPNAPKPEAPSLEKRLAASAHPLQREQYRSPYL